MVELRGRTRLNPRNNMYMAIIAYFDTIFDAADYDFEHILTSKSYLEIIDGLPDLSRD